MDNHAIASLRTKIDKAAQAYYRTDSQPIISDAEYDKLLGQLKAVAPDDIRLTRVGVPYQLDELREKVTHPIPMGSLDNTEDGVTGFAKWHADVGSLPVCASLKVDGSSIRLKYRKGILVEAATRGNGEIGELITANVINFQNVPSALPKPIDIDVRGEAILYLEDYRDIRSKACGCAFDQIAEKDRSNPRNIGNGIIGRDDGTDTDKMRFLAFNAVTDQSFESERHKLDFIQEMGFDVVPHRFCGTAADLHEYYEEVSKLRNDLPFEIDGVVVCIDDIQAQQRFVTADIKSKLRPKYARAIKFPHKSNITTLVDYIVSIGHTGALVPTAVLDQVRVGGVNVTHALLNNWDEIDRLGVSVGDKVEVVLAGDIIPKIVRVVEPSANSTPIAEPTHCPFCNSNTTRYLRGKHGAMTYCVNRNCDGIMLQKISKWIGGSKTGVGILGIGDTILNTLWEKRIVRDPADLYILTADDIKDLRMDDTDGARIGESRAAEIVSNIAGKRLLSLDVFLGSLGIELLGKRRVKLLQQAANGMLDKLEDWLDDTKLSNIQIEGFGDTIRDSVRAGIDDNRHLIDKLIRNGVVIQYENASTTHDMNNNVNNEFAGLSFCFTGTRECVDEVSKLGGEIKSSVSKSKPSPDFLVQKDPTSTSTKTQNAEMNGHTRIISVDFLKKCLNGQAKLADVIRIDLVTKIDRD